MSAPDPSVDVPRAVADEVMERVRTDGDVDLEERRRRAEERRRAHEASLTRRTTPFRGPGVSHPDEWSDHHWTSRTLHRAGSATSVSGTGVLAGALAVGWAVVGAIAGFPSWWQTALYSVTGSVTFVMVFVLQHTQARQVTSMQRKLDELLRTSTRADDSLIAVEEASDAELQALAELNVEDRRAASTAAVPVDIPDDVSPGQALNTSS
jgi:low affinity Fe/Cu permease